MNLGRRRRRVSSSPTSLRGSGANSLSAAGYRIRRKDADVIRRLAMPWQTRSLTYYDVLGEINYAAQFYARSLSKLTLFAAEMDENEDLVPTENQEVIDQLERLQDPGGGRSGLLGTYGRLMFLTGEALLFCTFPEDDDGDEQWEMLSSDELKIMQGSYMRYKAPSLQVETYREPSDDDFEPIDKDHAIAYRLWKRHPRFSAWPDAPMQGVLGLCEELLLLERAVRARARSRTAGMGILLIDEAISPAPLEAGPDEDPEEDIFLRDLTNAMTEPIADEGSAAAVVPLVVRAQSPDGKSIKDMIAHIQLVDPTQLYPETGLRMECVKRLAIGLDMPPEILVGMTEANHWSAWQIDEQAWKAHLEPVALQLVDDLTSSFFRPTLKEAGVQDYKNYYVAFDASALIVHPDRTKDAISLYELEIIGKEPVRRVADFNEEDAMTEEELAERIGIKTRDSSLAWYGEPSPRGGNVEPEPGVIVNADNPGDGAGATKGAEVEKGPPSSGSNKDLPEPGLTGSTNGHSALAARILGAADLALFRAREAAGNRLRSLAKRDEEAAALIDGVRAGQVAVVLGPERVKQLNASVVELVSCAGELITDALNAWDLPADVAERVAKIVEGHAARTLYEKQPGPLPSSFGHYLEGLTLREER